MKILFIHQNFPAQFKHLAPALSQRGHNVKALKLALDESIITWNGIQIHHYLPISESHADVIHPWVADFETKIIRAHSCLLAAEKIKNSGFYPEVIIAHHGWGESLFLKDLWPNSKLGIYCEFYYLLKDSDASFDPEFKRLDQFDFCRLKLKNLNNDLHFPLVDKAISPTHWQASTFPLDFSSKISVIHDGINTKLLKPDNQASALLSNEIKLTSNDEVISFVNRNLEPYRGYHIFMRCLPEVLSKNPNVRVLIIGGDQHSYGPKAPDGRTWKDIYASEIEPKLTIQQKQRIHFLGKIDYVNYISVLQISSVHVYLTYPFVLSWSLLEALSIGCSVIASDTKPLQEVIIDNENGLLTNFFDHINLSKKILYLLKNNKLRKKLSINARNFVKEKYDLNTICLPKQIKWVESFHEGK